MILIIKFKNQKQKQKEQKLTVLVTVIRGWLCRSDGSIGCSNWLQKAGTSCANVTRMTLGGWLKLLFIIIMSNIEKNNKNGNNNGRLWPTVVPAGSVGSVGR
jgi:hypothetical protein